jgi:hypothetical protein
MTTSHVRTARARAQACAHRGPRPRSAKGASTTGRAMTLTARSSTRSVVRIHWGAQRLQGTMTGLKTTTPASPPT